MSSYEQSVSLLRANKRAQVEAIRALGFTGVTVQTRASLFPTYIRWAHGLLDITVAVRYKGDGPEKGSHYYFTPQEWTSLSSSERSNYVMRGLRLRAEAVNLVIALTQQLHKWGTTTSVSGAGAGTPPAMYYVADARHQTELIAVANEGASNANVTGAPAAEFAIGYTAFTEANAGFADVTEWAIPTLKYLMLMYKYRNELNQALQIIGADVLTPAIYWSCNQSSATAAVQLSMANGVITTSNKSTTSLVVRPVAVEEAL